MQWTILMDRAIDRTGYEIMVSAGGSMGELLEICGPEECELNICPPGMYCIDDVEVNKSGKEGYSFLA